MERKPVFGVSIVPYAADHRQIVDDVQFADRSGLELVGIQDHPYQRRYLDTFALIADLQARTERIRFFPDVASLPMRGATMLAKAAASLDVMSGGRFELGIGAGNFWDAVAGMGGPRRTAPESFDALEEAIPIIRGALDVGPERRVVRGEGQFYPVPGYPPGPPPAHRVQIWVGAYRPRGLRLIARMADGWVPSVGYAGIGAIRESAARLDDEIQAAGRQPREVLRIFNIGGAVSEMQSADNPMDGPPDRWVSILAEWSQDPGVDAFIYWHPDRRSLERFVAEVVPAVTEALARS